MRAGGPGHGRAGGTARGPRVSAPSPRSSLGAEGRDLDLCSLTLAARRAGRQRLVVTGNPWPSPAQPIPKRFKRLRAPVLPKISLWCLLEATLA